MRFIVRQTCDDYKNELNAVQQLFGTSFTAALNVILAFRFYAFLDASMRD